MLQGRKGRPFDGIKDFCCVAAEWPDLLIWATGGQIRMTPYKEFISGRAKPFPANGRFIKADCNFIKANGHFIKLKGSATLELG